MVPLKLKHLQGHIESLLSAENRVLFIQNKQKNRKNQKKSYQSKTKKKNPIEYTQLPLISCHERKPNKIK